MARPFSVNQSGDDFDLHLLVDAFIRRRPDYLPVAGNNGVLILLPYTESWEEHEQSCGSVAGAREPQRITARKHEPLM